MRKAWELLRWALTTEWRMYVGAARLVARRPDVPDDSEPVPYVAAVSAVLWGITAVSTIELVVLHLVIPWHSVRLAADVLGIWGVVWCLGFTACHYAYPHLAGPDALQLRVQRHRPAVTVPWDAVASVRTRERSLESGRAVQVTDGVVSVAAAKRTDVEITLSRPVSVEVGGVTHEVHEVRVGADQPRALAELVRRRTAGGASKPV